MIVMAVNYAYYYARVRESDGLCVHVRDTSSYILDRFNIPIPEYNTEYALKYYYPIPETVTSFDDFQGKWYTDAAHTNEWIPE